MRSYKSMLCYVIMFVLLFYISYIKINMLSHVSICYYIIFIYDMFNIDFILNIWFIFPLHSFVSIAVSWCLNFPLDQKTDAWAHHDNKGCDFNRRSIWLLHYVKPRLHRFIAAQGDQRMIEGIDIMSLRIKHQLWRYLF